MTNVAADSPEESYAGGRGAVAVRRSHRRARSDSRRWWVISAALVGLAVLVALSPVLLSREDSPEDRRDKVLAAVNALEDYYNIAAGQAMQKISDSGREVLDSETRQPSDPYWRTWCAVDNDRCATLSYDVLTILRQDLGLEFGELLKNAPHFNLVVTGIEIRGSVAAVEAHLVVDDRVVDGGEMLFTQEDGEWKLSRDDYDYRELAE